MMATSALLLQPDPFEFLLRQKSGRFKPHHQKNIKLNLNRLPANFFPRQPTKRQQSHSHRQPVHNQFLQYHNTLELRSERKVSSQTKEPRRINPFSVKRESLCSSRRVETQRQQVSEPREDEFQGFNCTFARQMNSECVRLKKLQFPLL